MDSEKYKINNIYQNKVSEFTKKYNLSGSIETRFIDLTSELGELGKEILKGSDYGQTEFSETDNMVFEFGDVMFSLICLANEVGIDLGVALDRVLQKYENRFNKNGHIGSGE